MNYLEALASGKPFTQEGYPIYWRTGGFLLETHVPVSDLQHGRWFLANRVKLRETTGWKLVEDSIPATTISSNTTWTLPDDYIWKQTDHLESLASGAVNGTWSGADDEQPECIHDWVNTGMKRSWCKKCNCNAVLSAAGKWEKEGSR